MSSVLPGTAEGELRRARAELESSLRGGGDARAEALLTAYPAVATDPEAALELVYTEFVVRQELGQNPTPADWIERFPQYRADLEQMFEVHDELCRSDAITRHDGLGAVPASRAVMIPGYQILGEVGRGGMGVVYQARDVRLNRVVAVKVILSGELAGAKERGRFRREAEAAARLDHPNIARVYEVGDAAGRPYCAMEFVGGGPLAARMTGAPWPVAAAAKLVAELARAAEHAHGRGVVHRDIKPANVLLGGARGKGQGAREEESDPAPSLSQLDSSSLAPCPLPLAPVPKLVDFGLAKCLLDSDQGLTRTGDVVGTPMYMAPEQAAGARDVGPAADVWALGVILYELLTGRPPFRGETAAETRHLVLTAEPVPPRQLRAKLPRDLDTVCLRALQKETHRRYASAAALADDLERWAAGKPIAARPVRWPEKVAKWARREPVVAGLAVAVGLVALAGLGGVLWQWDRADRGWREAVEAGRQVSRARDDEARLRALEADARESAEARFHNSQIARAALDVSAARTATAARTLDELKAREPARCRWEWDYLKRRCNAHLVEMVGHTQLVNSVIYSPDGARVYSAAGPWNGPDPGEVKVWDANTGALLHDLPGAPTAVNRLALRGDGKELAGGCGAGTVARWDVSGREPRPLPPLDTGTTAYAVAFHPAEPLLAVGGADGYVQLWNTDLGVRLLRQPWHSGNIYDVAFSPDGKLFASTNRDGAVAVRRTSDFALVKELRLVTDARRVVFGADSRMLATLSHDGEIALWDAAEDCRRAAAWNVGLANYRALGITPDGRHVVCSVRNADPRAWFVRGQAEVRLSNAGATTAFGFRPDGARFAAAREDHVIQVWDQTAPADPRVHEWGTAWVTGLAPSPDGRTVAVAGGLRWSHRVGGKMVGLLDLERGGITDLRGHDGHVNGVAYRPDGKELASCDDAGAVIRWDAATRKETSRLRGHAGAVHGVGYARAGDRLATAGADKTARVWAVADGAEVGRFEHPAEVRAVAFSPDGLLVATGCDDRVVRVWDAATGRLRHTLPGHRAGVAAAAFRPGTAELVTADDGGEVRFWDAAAGKDLTAHDAPAPVGGADEARPTAKAGASLAFSPDGTRVAVGSVALSVQVWDAGTRRPLLDMDAIAGGARQCVAFTTDGSRLIAGERVAIRVWDSRLTPVVERRAAAEARVPAWHAERFKTCDKTGEWAAAEFHAGKLMERNPGDPRWAAARSRVRAALGPDRDAAALADHERALALNIGRSGPRPQAVPGSAFIWLQYAEAQAYRGRWDEAIRANQLSLVHNPASWSGWANVAVAELARGDRAAYDAGCADMAKRFGGSTSEQTYRTFQTVMASPKALDAAGWLKLGERAKAFGGWRVEAAVLVRAGRPADALRVYESKLAEPRAWEMLFRALALRRLGRHEQAEAWVTRAKVWVAEADRVANDPASWAWDTTRWDDWTERVVVAALLREAAPGK
ncbi:MAG TPA: protein kinase [Urbifossiella sp.]|nr:protein kinase [Urbifossiella sp.]